MAKIQIEYPGNPEIVTMLEDGEAFAADLYPTESNYCLSVDALQSSDIRFSLRVTYMASLLALALSP